MRRWITVISLVGFVSLGCVAFAVKEVGIHVSLDRLARLSSETGRWFATVEAYLRSELDPVWRVETGLGFDVGRMAPYGRVGFLRHVLTDMNLEADLMLQWIPRHGMIGRIDTGIRYHPMIAESTRLLLEVYPIEWNLISVEHRYFPIPEWNLAMTVGLQMELSQGGFFGESITLDGYQLKGGRLPFSVFVGNDWYLTAGQFTTRVGYGW